MWFLSPPTLVFVFFKSQCLRMVEIACFRWSRFLVPANLWRTDAKTRVPSGCGPGVQDIHPFTTSRKRRGSGSRAARRAACCPYIFFSVNILVLSIYFPDILFSECIFHNGRQNSRHLYRPRGNAQPSNFTKSMAYLQWSHAFILVSLQIFVILFNISTVLSQKQKHCSARHTAHFGFHEWKQPFQNWILSTLH